MLKRASLLAALYVLAGSFFCLVVAFYRLQGRPVAQSFAGWTFVALVVSAVFFAVASASLASHFLHREQRGSKEYTFTLLMGCVALACICIGGELLTRLLAEEEPEGAVVGDTVLLPRDWTRVVTHRRSVWEKASREYGVFVHDETLGWTVGRHRQGVGPFGETYFSNEEGLRTVGREVVLRDRPAALRIALVGDSYTFGEDVSYEDSWGYQLEKRLGPDVQILNFGVPGYGIDQAYLRYLRDVRDWHPDIVVLSCISHDFLRNGMVYYWIGFPGAVVPGAKPRFALKGEELTLLNVPLPYPDEIHAASSITDLPFIQFDRAYVPAHWEKHLYRFSYLLRFAISWRLDSFLTKYELVEEDIQAVSRRVLQSFVRTVREAGSVPMVLLLPEYMELHDSIRLPSGRELLGKRVAQDAGVEYFDLTPCLESVEGTHRFTTGWHYTARANNAVARCLQQTITDSRVLAIPPAPLKRITFHAVELP